VDARPIVIATAIVLWGAVPARPERGGAAELSAQKVQARTPVRPTHTSLEWQRPTMVIAFLALLGVDLIIIVGFVASVLSRKRWVMRQPGAFRGAIRVADGEVDGIGPTWHRGYGRWVRDVLVWTKAPFLFRNDLVAVDGLDERRPTRTDEVERLGEHPVVVRVRAGTAAVEVAAGRDDEVLLHGPYPVPLDVPMAVESRADTPAVADSAGQS
jgi:hypothetical protein